MERDEMLKLLKSIPIGARPTVYTTDLGIQYEFATKNGCGECLGSMGDWPVHVVREISPQMLKRIQLLITERSLSVEDIRETGLGSFFAYVFGCDRPGVNTPDINTFFAGLCKLNGLEESVYILCDGREWEPKVLFFESYEAVAEAFEKKYVRDIVYWDDLDDEELSYWIRKIKNELSCIAVNDW